ncbi:unnamed protein product [Ectocarpus sp. 12 AP-2014]
MFPVVATPLPPLPLPLLPPPPGVCLFCAASARAHELPICPTKHGLHNAPLRYIYSERQENLKEVAAALWPRFEITASPSQPHTLLLLVPQTRVRAQNNQARSNLLSRFSPRFADMTGRRSSLACRVRRTSFNLSTQFTRSLQSEQASGVLYAIVKKKEKKFSYYDKTPGAANRKPCDRPPPP